MIVEAIFPIPVGTFHLGRSFTEEELGFIRNQEVIANVSNAFSKDTYILKNPEMGNIKTFISSCVKEYFQEIYKPQDGVDIYLTQSWLNYTKPGQHHHRHLHKNSIISGCLYINANPEYDKIYVYKPGHKQIEIVPKEWNLYNSESWWFSVDSCSLVLFPSYLEHDVKGTENEGTRISLAFNTFVTGVIGEHNNLTELKLEK